MKNRCISLLFVLVLSSFCSVFSMIPLQELSDEQVLELSCLVYPKYDYGISSNLCADHILTNDPDYVLRRFIQGKLNEEANKVFSKKTYLAHPDIVSESNRAHADLITNLDFRLEQEIKKANPGLIKKMRILEKQVRVCNPDLVKKDSDGYYVEIIDRGDDKTWNLKKQEKLKRDIVKLVEEGSEKVNIGHLLVKFAQSNDFDIVNFLLVKNFVNVKYHLKEILCSLELFALHGNVIAVCQVLSIVEKSKEGHIDSIKRREERAQTLLGKSVMNVQMCNFVSNERVVINFLKYRINKITSSKRKALVNAKNKCCGCCKYERCDYKKIALLIDECLPYEDQGVDQEDFFLDEDCVGFTLYRRESVEYLKEKHLFNEILKSPDYLVCKKDDSRKKTAKKRKINALYKRNQKTSVLERDSKKQKMS